MIASITGKCNLHCKGCYAALNNKNCRNKLSINKWDNIFNEAKELGISIILLAGGEPFIREDLIQIVLEYKKIIFPVFTISTLITENTS